MNLQIGTNKLDINFSNAMNIATDFDKIQSFHMDEGVFDFNNSNEGSNFEMNGQVKCSVKLDIGHRSTI